MRLAMHPSFHEIRPLCGEPAGKSVGQLSHEGVDRIGRSEGLGSDSDAYPTGPGTQELRERQVDSVGQLAREPGRL